MRFKGTLVLMVLCLGVGAFVYFYEIKGGEQRTKAKEGENVVWKVPGEDIQPLDLITPAQHITAIRTGQYAGLGWDKPSWELDIPSRLI